MPLTSLILACKCVTFCSNVLVADVKVMELSNIHTETHLCCTQLMPCHWGCTHLSMWCVNILTFLSLFKSTEYFQDMMSSLAENAICVWDGIVVVTQQKSKFYKPVHGKSYTKALHTYKALHKLLEDILIQSVHKK